MSSPALIVINSAQLASGTPSSFTYNFQYTGVKSVRRFRVNKISIPFSYYPIVTSGFTVIWDGTPYQIEVQQGQWSATQLATNIAASLNAAAIAGAGTWTVTFNIFTAIFTIAVQHGTFQLNFTPVLFGFPYPQQYNIGVQMGFVNIAGIGSNTPSAAISSVSGPFYANLGGTTNIYVLSQSLQLYDTAWFCRQINNVVQSVPVDANPGSLIVWQNSVATTFPFDGGDRALQNFDFSLVDDFNYPINLNGLDWTIELEVFFDS